MPPSIRHEHDPMLHPEEVEGVPRPARNGVKWAMYALALALLAGCVWMAWGEIRAGSEKLWHADRGDVTLMLLTVVLNIALDGLVFWMLLIPFRPSRPVKLGEMTALIGATSLLNYLPMRVGMIGRAAYLKQRHGVSYAASVVMVLAIAASTVAIYALLLAATYVTREVNGTWWAILAIGLTVLSMLSVMAARFGRRWAPRKLLHYFDDAHAAIDWFNHHRLASHGLMLAIYVTRVGGMLVRIWLLWTAARVLGTPIEPHTAVVMTVAGMFITIATPLPNGLGLREWVYGVLAASGVAGAALPSGTTGVAIGLIERAIEAIVFVALGSVALAYIHRKGASKEPSPGTGNP